MKLPRITARVRSVLSADSLVVVTTDGESISVLLGGIQAPKYNSKDVTASEPYSYFAREYLRKILVGHKVQLEITKELQNSPKRVIADAFLASNYINERVLLAGWGTVRTSCLLSYMKLYMPQHDASKDLDAYSKGDILSASNLSSQQENPKKLETRLVEAYLKARFTLKVGMYSGDETLKCVPQIEDIPASQILSQFKDKVLDGSVEYVKDAGCFIALVRTSDSPLKCVKVSCSPFGVAASNEMGAVKLCASAAQEFATGYLTGKTVKVTPLLCAGNILLCKVIVSTSGSPDKDYAHTLLSMGYAQCMQWMADIDSTILNTYHKAEQEAKEKRAGIWRDNTGKTAEESILLDSLSTKKTYTGTVVDIPSSDSLVIQLHDMSTLRLWFSSLLMPKCTLSKKTTEVEETGFMLREYLRRNYLGQTVSAKLDYIRDPPASNLDLAARPYFSVYLKHTGENIALDLIKSTGCTVIHHPISEANRSRDYAALIAAQEEGSDTKKQTGKQGEKKSMLKVVDYSSYPTATLATQVRDLAREHDGCYRAVIDSVITGNKMRVIMTHKHGMVHIGLVTVAGIVTPSVKRNEAFGAEAINYAKSVLFMKDVKLIFTGAVEKHTNALVARVIFSTQDENEQDFGESLIEQGFGEVIKGKAGSALNIPPEYMQKCFALETEAKKKGIGLFKFHIDTDSTCLQKPGSWDAPEIHRIYGLQFLDDGRFVFCLADNTPPVITAEMMRKTAAKPVDNNSLFAKQIVVYHDRERDEYFRARIERLSQDATDDIKDIEDSAEGGNNVHLYLLDFGRDIAVTSTDCLYIPVPAGLLDLQSATIKGKLALLRRPGRDAIAKKVVDEEFFDLVRQNIVGTNLICYACGYDRDGLLNVFLFTEDTENIEIDGENGPTIDVAASMSSWVVSEGLGRLISDEDIPSGAHAFYDVLAEIEKSARRANKGIWK